MAAVKMCQDSGIMAHVSFILGLPGETPETLKETVDFGERLKELGAYHGFHLLAPFPGTEVRQESEKYGIKILTDDWTQYHANRAIVETSSVSQRMLDETVIEWEKEFDEQLGEIKRRMVKGEATKEEAWQLQKLEHTVFIYDLMMGRILEEKGFWNNQDRTGSGDALKKLINKIGGSLDYSQDQISETLNFAMDQGYLKYENDKGQIRWKWVDFL
jgi:radical SAM superfamily enzyme YgiQ (UPF0313 family)